MLETKQWYTLDKIKWGVGPWAMEPDKMQWEDAATGLPCIILRQRDMGALCGYVGVYSDHPLFGKEYTYAYSEPYHIDVHGGLTFSGFCRENSPKKTTRGISESSGIPGSGCG